MTCPTAPEAAFDATVRQHRRCFRHLGTLPAGIEIPLKSGIRFTSGDTGLPAPAMPPRSLVVSTSPLPTLR